MNSGIYRTTHHPDLSCSQSSIAGVGDAALFTDVTSAPSVARGSNRPRITQLEFHLLLPGPKRC
jgi:hypothetical protein